MIAFCDISAMCELIGRVAALKPGRVAARHRPHSGPPAATGHVVACHKPQRLDDSHSQLPFFPPLRGANGSKGSLRGVALREKSKGQLYARKAKVS
jgi:hypothetical protein